MSKLRTKSALSYFGSDSEVAAELAAMLDHCNHVTIPFVGGASILLHLKARAIVANDLHDFVINFYRHMSGVMGLESQALVERRCLYTLSHPSELECASSLLTRRWRDSWQQAWAFWAMCWIGRKGKGGTKHQGGMPSVRRTASGGTNASRIRAAANDLTEWARQFERCEWECVDFRELLPKVADLLTCGVYCDPPWIDKGKDYLHSFTEQDHRDLADGLRRFEYATVVVRYGDHELIRDLYAGWWFTDASSRNQAGAVNGEVWITNREAKDE